MTPMDSEKIFILGHRGFRGTLENTLPAFRRALKYADGVEFDVRLTADGELVVHHDEGFFSSGDFYSLNELTVLELKRLHPQGRLIPRVGELFREFKGALFNADVKETGAIEKLLKTAEKLKTLEKTVFSSENPAIVKALARECPDCRVGFSIVGYSSLRWIIHLRGLYSLHVPIDAVSYVGYNAVVSLMKTFRRKGLRIYLWNYEMDELSWAPRFRPFVDAIISDDPSRLRKVFY